MIQIMNDTFIPNSLKYIFHARKYHETNMKELMQCP